MGADDPSAAGPFDIIGDVHGCHEELSELLACLGYVAGGGGGPRHPAGRRAIFVGDLVNRGPATPEVLRLAMSMVASGDAACVQGNHDLTLLEALRARGVGPPTGSPGPSPAPGDVEEAMSHGLAESLQQLEGELPEFLARVAGFLEGLAAHLVLDGGDLVVAHAGTPPELWGHVPPGTVVVYGHTPVASALWTEGTICIDTGCVYGGSLTALRYPERELVSVAAHKIYWLPAHLRSPGL
jgi:diadenosine tetraphosphatase ApaH/serine/threonine PP2A family protein phosphatase